MGIYLNPGNDLFQIAVNSEIYVDKSMLISYANSRINTEQRFMCVSRPRRFGKSMAANMLAAYYSKGCDSKELFSGLEIAKDKSFAKNLNQYDVIQVNVHDFLGERDTVSDCIRGITVRILSELKEAYADLEAVDYESGNLPEALKKIYYACKTPFIFIIDEWDCVFRIRQEEKEEQKEYLDFIRNLFKDKPYAALVYMTGILPIKKYGQHSALNMFDEYSMTEQAQLREFTGFTEGEVEELCQRYQMSFEDTKLWYDGYSVDGISIYNPRSVTQAMLRRRFNSYWTATETYEALKKYILLDAFGLHDMVTRLIAGERLSIDTSTFTNDMVTFSSADDVLTLLVHLGYLTYEFETQSVWIPNDEVRQEYVSSVKDGGWENVMRLIRASDELLNAVLQMEEEKAAELLEQVHQDNTSIFEYNDENSLSCVVALAFYAANRSYVFHRELPSGKGRADLVLIPRKKSDQPGIVVELKYNATAEDALAQIKKKNYADSMRGLADKAYLVGFGYDADKHHQCRIEQIQI